MKIKVKVIPTLWMIVLSVLRIMCMTVPEQAEDQMSATEHFCREFASRYIDVDQLYFD